MFHAPNHFLSYILIIFSFLSVPVSASTAAAASSTDPITTDPRHVLVRKARADFTTEGDHPKPGGQAARGNKFACFRRIFGYHFSKDGLSA